MKGTQALEATTRLLERDVVADDVDDIARSANGFNEIRGKTTHVATTWPVRARGDAPGLPPDRFV